MAKAHRYFIGAGCLLIVLGTVILAIMVRGLSAPPLPREMVLSLRLAGPIAEVTADDPVSELMGEQPTSLRDLREVLVRAATDDRVQGLRLRIDSIGGGFATAQEIRTLISRFGAAGNDFRRFARLPQAHDERSDLCLAGFARHDVRHGSGGLLAGLLQKRGGQVTIIEWDALDPEARYALEPAHVVGPGAAFDRAWARETIDIGVGSW